MALSAVRGSLMRQAARLLEKSAKGTLVKQEKLDVLRNVRIPNQYPLILNALATTHLQVRDYSKQAKPLTKPQRLYDSDSDSDWETLGHRGESEFWRRKMRTFHRILDVNRDGVVSYDDFTLLADRFINLGHLTDKQSQDFKCLIRNLWERQWGEITPYNLVTVEQYLEDMHHVLNDKDLVKRACGFLPYFFKAVDKDSSGFINLEEFTHFYTCLGIEERDAVLSFRIIDTNGDGKVSFKEFIKHGKDFFLTEDESSLSKYFWGPLIDH